MKVTTGAGSTHTGAGATQTGAGAMTTGTGTGKKKSKKCGWADATAGTNPSDNKDNIIFRIGDSFF
jgi:hypothetical protein